MAKRTKRVRQDVSRAEFSKVLTVRVDAGDAETILKLKLQHLIVLEALENANLTHTRVVSTAEIANVLTATDRKRLEESYANNLGRIIAKILELLCTRGLVFSLTAANGRCFFGSVRVLSPDGGQAPIILSRRSKVLELVREAVTKHGRGVRVADVVEHAAASEYADDIPPIEITRDVLSLEQTGELSIIARLRGDGKGVNLYLPSELDPKQYMPTEPLTWLEQVINAFDSIWADHAKAAAEGLLPHPVSTGEVRAWLKTSMENHANLNDPMILINAMQQLARTENPTLRKIKRGDRKAVLWAPVGVKDKELRLSDAYPSDMERVTEAVKRAVKRLGRPVNAKDVGQEFALDPFLQPVGSQRTFELLSEAAKANAEVGGDGWTKRARQRIFRAGRLVGRTYYCVDNVQEANAYIRLRQLDSQWAASGADEELSAVASCVLRSLAAGRVLHLVTQAKDILRKVDDILIDTNCDGTTHREANDLRRQVSECEQSALNWLSSHASETQNLPAEVSMEIPGWTGKDIFPILLPLYPFANETKSAKKVTLYLAQSIRRIPNPEYRHRFSDTHNTAVAFLFDRTDALLYIAKQWGGHECCLQAMIARNELGLLRDPRFVFPAFESSDFEVRLAGVACLAFLWSEEGNRLLKEVATSDPDFGVRQSALWAYAFAGGGGAVELTSNLAEGDAHPHVRSFAKQMLEPNDKGLWAL